MTDKLPFDGKHGILLQMQRHSKDSYWVYTLKIRNWCTWDLIDLVSQVRPFQFGSEAYQKEDKSFIEKAYATCSTT
jgi:hypothetical protein